MKIKFLQQGWDAYRSWQRIKAQAVIIVRKGGLDIDGQGGEVALVQNSLHKLVLLSAASLARVAHAYESL